MLITDEQYRIAYNIRKRDEWWKCRFRDAAEIENRINQYYGRKGRNIVILELMT